MSRRQPLVVEQIRAAIGRCAIRMGFSSSGEAGPSEMPEVTHCHCGAAILPARFEREPWRSRCSACRAARVEAVSAEWRKKAT